MSRAAWGRGFQAGLAFLVGLGIAGVVATSLLPTPATSTSPEERLKTEPNTYSSEGPSHPPRTRQSADPTMGPNIGAASPVASQPEPPGSTDSDQINPTGRPSSGLSDRSAAGAVDEAARVWASAGYGATPPSKASECEGMGPTVHVSELDGPGGVLALTTLCRDGAGTSSYVIRFDSSEDWSATDAVPSGHVDLLSIAVHEFGHVVGHDRHHAQSICVRIRPTMCARHPFGTSVWRSLEAPDVTLSPSDEPSTRGDQRGGSE